MNMWHHKTEEIPADAAATAIKGIANGANTGVSTRDQEDVGEIADIAMRRDRDRFTRETL